MSRRIRWALTGALVALAFGVAAAAHAEPTRTLSVSLDMQTVSISIAGGDVSLGGGPHPSNTALQAHLQASIRESLPPTIKNEGNVAIGSLVVKFTGAPGEEATCSNGGTWAADTSTAQDRFVVRAWASANGTYNNFNSSSLIVAPAGSANVLAAAHNPLDPLGTVPLQLEVVTPNPAVSGTTGCTIGLSVTAAAAPPPTP